MNNMELYFKLQEAMFASGEKIYRGTPFNKSNVTYKIQFSLLIEEYKRITNGLADDFFQIKTLILLMN